MNWKELIRTEAESAYDATEGLFELVDPDGMGWKPSDGHNWMTTGQLLRHITESCGFCIRGFVTGDWSMPDDYEGSEMVEEGSLPSADKMPSVTGLEEARRLLAQDRKLAFDMLESVTEEELADRALPAPWNPVETNLGAHLLHMVEHLSSHKSQLFYYLKLQGKPVHTGTLWGM